MRTGPRPKRRSPKTSPGRDRGRSLDVPLPRPVPDAVLPAAGRTAGTLEDVYHRLHEFYGPQRWWPADSVFEMIVGAILTQSAAWSNVEKAIASLKAAGTLSAAALRDMPQEALARLVYPSGYYNAKAAKLKAFVRHLARYDDDLTRLFDKDVAMLREELLGIHGVGEETADSIILYAANKPSFVVDAYTRRILERLGVEPASRTYAGYQALFHAHLPSDVEMFNEYHALLVRLGKDICRKLPRCGECPLLEICPAGQGGKARKTRTGDLTRPVP